MWLPCLLAIFLDMQHLEHCLITVLPWYCLKCYSLLFIYPQFCLVLSSHLLVNSIPPFLVSISRMLLEEFWGWLVPCLLKLSFSLLEVPMQMPTKQENSVRNQDHPFQHPRLRKTSRHTRSGWLFFIFTLGSKTKSYSVAY